MQDVQIEGVIDALIEAKIMSAIDKKKATETLQEYWNSCETLIEGWSISDVQERTQDALNKTLSDEDAKKVLLRVADEYDANFGITNADIVDAAEKMAEEGLIELLDHEGEEGDEN